MLLLPGGVGWGRWWGGRTLCTPASYPALRAGVSWRLLRSLRPNRAGAGSRRGAGRGGLTEGFEGAEEGTVVVHGGPCPRERRLRPRAAPHCCPWGALGDNPPKALHLPIALCPPPRRPPRTHVGRRVRAPGTPERQTPGWGRGGGSPQPQEGERDQGGGHAGLCVWPPRDPRARPPARHNIPNPRQMLEGVEEAGAGRAREAKLSQRSRSRLRRDGGSQPGWGTAPCPHLYRAAAPTPSPGRKQSTPQRRRGWGQRWGQRQRPHSPGVPQPGGGAGLLPCPSVLVCAGGLDVPLGAERGKPASGGALLRETLRGRSCPVPGGQTQPEVLGWAGEQPPGVPRPVPTAPLAGGSSSASPQPLPVPVPPLGVLLLPPLPAPPQPPPRAPRPGTHPGSSRGSAAGSDGPGSAAASPGLGSPPPARAGSGE